MDTMTGRDKQGRWLPGVSGNPKGRPRGARDKWPGLRLYLGLRFSNVDPTPRLGRYAITGGPGRPTGSTGKKYRVLMDLLTSALINPEKT